MSETTSQAQMWTDLLLILEDFYRRYPGSDLPTARAHIANQEIVQQNRLEFGQAYRIDTALFGENHNTHWVEAFNYPIENCTVSVQNVDCIAYSVGIFTFRPQVQVQVQV